MQEDTRDMKAKLDQTEKAIKMLISMMTNVKGHYIKDVNTICTLKDNLREDMDHLQLLEFKMCQQY